MHFPTKRILNTYIHYKSCVKSVFTEISSAIRGLIDIYLWLRLSLTYKLWNEIERAIWHGNHHDIPRRSSGSKNKIVVLNMPELLLIHYVEVGQCWCAHVISNNYFCPILKIGLYEPWVWSLYCPDVIGGTTFILGHCMNDQETCAALLILVR